MKCDGVGNGRSGARAARFGSLGCLVLFLSGATGVTVRAEETSSIPAAVQVIDQRPAAELGSKSGSLLITSCDYAVRQLGDHDLRFDRVASLRDALQDSVAASVGGKPVTLVHHGIYINPAEIFRRSAQAAAFHIVEVDKLDRGSQCAKEKMSGGWYGPGESTTRFAPIIVEIGVLIEGVRYDVRTVYSPDRDPVRYRSEESTALVLAASHQAEQAVAQALAR